MLEFLRKRSCPECSQPGVSIIKLSRKMVCCNYCGNCFRLKFTGKIGSAVLSIIAVPMIIVLIPTLGIFGSIAFCFVFGSVIEYLIFRYCPLTRRENNDS